MRERLDLFAARTELQVSVRSPVGRVVGLACPAERQRTSLLRDDGRAARIERNGGQLTLGELGTIAGCRSGGTGS